MRVAINGFGRIGRMILRTALKYEKGADIDFVAVNDLADIDMLIHLLRYDSNYGILEQEIEKQEDIIRIGDMKIKTLSIKDPEELPWDELGVDIAVESTGLFRKREDAQKHLNAGAKKVLVSAPMKGKGSDITIVLGVNEEKYEPRDHNIISNASCTTNGLAPLCKVLNDEFEIKKGLMSTIHAYTNDQNLLDLPHKDYRRARAAAVNVVPTTTGAAKALGLVIPELEGRLDGMALRVPVPVGSLIDLTVELGSKTSIEGINTVFREKSQEKRYRNIIAYSDQPIVSKDIVGSNYSTIFDSPSTMQVDDMFKVMSWYDNEWGYSARCVDLIRLLGESL